LRITELDKDNNKTQDKD